MKRENKVRTEKILTLTVFTVLAVCVILVLLIGTKGYKRLVDRGEESFESRTVPLYIATKVRQADRAGAITTEYQGGVNVLQLKEYIDGTCYMTQIYCYDEYVRELFAEETVRFEPSAGERIAPAEELSFFLEGNVLRIVITQEDGVSSEQMLTLRSGGREAGDEK